jgi:hypothetical protein
MKNPTEKKPRKPSADTAKSRDSKHIQDIISRLLIKDSNLKIKSNSEPLT